MKLKVLLQPEPEGGYSASVPALPGCYSQGETRQEVLENIREAAEALARSRGRFGGRSRRRRRGHGRT